MQNLLWLFITLEYILLIKICYFPNVDCGFFVWGLVHLKIKAATNDYFGNEMIKWQLAAVFHTQHADAFNR